jgi:hypothetical protein
VIAKENTYKEKKPIFRDWEKELAKKTALVS